MKGLRYAFLDPLLTLCLFRSPDGGEGGAGGAGAGDGADTAAGGQGDDTAAGATGNDTVPGGAGGDKPARPEWLPEAFWDPEKGEAKVEDLAKAWAETQKKPEGVPETPDGYEFKAPELDLPDGVEIKVDADHPLVKTWREVCHKAGYDQAAFDAGVKAYFEAMLAQTPSRAEVLQALGEKGEERLKRVDTWLAGILQDPTKPQDSRLYDALADSIFSAEGVEALERLMEKVTGATIPPANAGGGTQPGITLEELERLQNTPAYYRDRDPATVKRVEEGYKALFPGYVVR